MAEHHVLVRHHRESYWCRLVRRFLAVLQSRETSVRYNGGKPMPCIEVEPLGSTRREAFMTPQGGGFVLSCLQADGPAIYEVVNIARDWYAVQIEEVQAMKRVQIDPETFAWNVVRPLTGEDVNTWMDRHAVDVWATLWIHEDDTITSNTLTQFAPIPGAYQATVAVQEV